MLTVKIVPNEKGNPPGKLADAELHFAAGVLDGLKLIGFAIWERRGGNGRNVTFPARSYTVNGDRRSFALLRPIADTTAQDRVRNLILDAYAQYERDIETTERLTVDQKAAQLYAAMDRNQRAGIRFGIFPAEIMRAAELDGYQGHALAVALMKCQDQEQPAKQTPTMLDDFQQQQLDESPF